MTLPDKTHSVPLELSLEPMEDGPLQIGAPADAKFHADVRSGKERRQLADRRMEIRFESDRRSGKDRRSKKSWEPGSNL